MTLIDSYLVTTRNVEDFLNALTTAQAPQVFTQTFLENLGFTSSNDRLFIGLLKGLKFIDANGAPVDRYFNFLDQGESKKVLARSIKEAYGDLFAINIKANEMNVEDVKNKLRTLTKGTKSEKVLGLMANTFVALSGYADWEGAPKKVIPEKIEKVAPEKIEIPKQENKGPSGKPKTSLHYHIQIHLPESRDPAVYDVLFRSLREHLY